MLALFFGQGLKVNGRAVLQDHMDRPYLRELVFEDIGRVIQGYGYDGAAGLFRHLHAALLKGKQFFPGLIPGSLRENAHRNSGLDLIDAF